MFSSSGIKRKLASIVAVLISLGSAVPGLDVFVGVLNSINAALGGAAVAHASATGTLGTYKLSGIASILTLIAGISSYIPVLAPYTAILQQIAGLFGAAGVTAVAVKK